MNKKILNYTFKKPSLLQNALTHTSFANEKSFANDISFANDFSFKKDKKKQKMQSNQRLEFLGDSVLSIIVSQFLYMKYPKLPEGELTRIRAAVVCEKTLSECANELKLGEMLLLGKGEQGSGGASRPSILSDAFESLLGAMYLDCGELESVRNFLLPLLQDKIVAAAGGSKVFADYKTQFQEIVQREQGKKIEYVTVDAIGPDHARVFVVNLNVDGKIIGTGQGKSKKEAEQNAAKAGIENL